MSGNLKGLFVKSGVPLQKIQGRCLVIDANNILRNYLGAIAPLYNSKNEVTSHYKGIAQLILNLHEVNIAPIFVFDGKIDHKYPSQDQGPKLTLDMIDNTKRFLSCMGVPRIDAPREATGLAAFMVREGHADFVLSFSYDALLYGAPQLLRETITKDKCRRNESFEVIYLDNTLKEQEISYQQLLQIAVLNGTKYNSGIDRIGARRGCNLIKKHGNISNVLSTLEQQIEDIDQIIDRFTDETGIPDYAIINGTFDEDKIIDFLCNENDFSESIVENIIQEMMRAIDVDQQTLFGFSSA